MARQAISHTAGYVERLTQTSTANTAQTLSAGPGMGRKLLFVTVQWSASVTQTTTITLNSGVGAAFDTLLPSLVVTAGQSGFYLPSGNIIILDDDAIDVAAPAGGAGVTSAIAIYVEAL